MIFNSQKGFTLLLAALVGSIVLAVGAAIFSIAQKQLMLTGIGRDSQFAFYAADSGLECGQYWDQAIPVNSAGEDPSFFGTTTPLYNGSAYYAVCSNQAITRPLGSNPISPAPPVVYPRWDQGTPSYTTGFQYDIPINGVAKYCVKVLITKSADPSSPSSWYSKIHADGYNVTCANITGPQAIQRSSELCFGPAVASGDFCY